MGSALKTPFQWEIQLGTHFKLPWNPIDHRPQFPLFHFLPPSHSKWHRHPPPVPQRFTRPVPLESPFSSPPVSPSPVSPTDSPPTFTWDPPREPTGSGPTNWNLCRPVRLSEGDLYVRVHRLSAQIFASQGHQPHGDQVQPPRSSATSIRVRGRVNQSVTHRSLPQRPSHHVAQSSSSAAAAPPGVPPVPGLRPRLVGGASRDPTQ